MDFRKDINPLQSLPKAGKKFLRNLLKDVDIITKDVGRNGYCRDYTLYSVFLDYFIRKHMSYQLNVAIMDFRTESILNKPQDYAELGRNPDLHKSIIKHYKVYKNSTTHAIDIVKSIQIVSLSYSIYYHCDITKTNFYVDKKNLDEITKYLQKLKYRMVELNPVLDCEYFHADANLIFDNEVIYETNMSKNISKDQFFIPIIHAFGFYKKTGEIIKKIIIYKPLLGTEYSIKLNNIDFVKLEKILKTAADKFNRLQEDLKTEIDNGLNQTSLEKLHITDANDMPKAVTSPVNTMPIKRVDLAKRNAKRIAKMTLEKQHITDANDMPKAVTSPVNTMPIKRVDLAKRNAKRNAKMMPKSSKAVTSPVKTMTKMP